MLKVLIQFLIVSLYIKAVDLISWFYLLTYYYVMYRANIIYVNHFDVWFSAEVSVLRCPEPKQVFKNVHPSLCFSHRVDLKLAQKLQKWVWLNFHRICNLERNRWSNMICWRMYIINPFFNETSPLFKNLFSSLMWNRTVGIISKSVT